MQRTVSLLITDQQTYWQIQVSLATRHWLHTCNFNGERVSKPDLLIPVPLHRSRLKQRGFNQALEISKVVSKHTAIPLGDRLVQKVKNTQSQAELESALKRKRIQRRAFSFSKTDMPGSVNHIAIIDDVVTTMATVKSLATCLESRGIRQVDVWCLARASL